MRLGETIEAKVRAEAKDKLEQEVYKDFQAIYSWLSGRDLKVNVNDHEVYAKALTNLLQAAVIESYAPHYEQNAVDEFYDKLKELMTRDEVKKEIEAQD